MKFSTIIISNLTHSLITTIDFIICFIHFNGMLVAKFCPWSFIFNNKKKKVKGSLFDTSEQE